MMPPLLEAALQAWIIITTVVAQVLLTTDTRYQRWGAVLGLIGQPAWIYSTWSHGQFGMFAVALIFCALYVNAIFRQWVEPLFLEIDVAVDTSKGTVTFNKPPRRRSTVTVAHRDSEVTVKVTPPAPRFPKI